MNRKAFIRKVALKRSTERTLRRARMRYNAPRVGTRRWLKARLDSLTAQIVKMRDRHRCVQCSSDYIIDCGHVFSRRFYATRWALDNTFAQCRKCNTDHIAWPERYMTWYSQKFGPGSLGKLRDRAYSGKTFTDEELKTMVTIYESRLTELRAEREMVV